MTLIANEPESQAMMGMARLAADPNNETAEFAVIVRTDMKGIGLGYALMTHILDYARCRGLHRVVGEVLNTNHTMLKMARELGFIVTSQDHDVVTVTLTL